MFRGYNRLAGLISSHPDLAIFPRYRALGARNLLYYSAELAVLSKELKGIIKRDANHQLPKPYESDVIELMRPTADVQAGHQREVTLEIRTLLREYCTRLASSISFPNDHNLTHPPDEALSLYSQILKLPPAVINDVKVLREFLHDDQGLNDELIGAEGELWEETNEADLISLTDRLGNRDSIFKFVDKHVMPVCSRLLGERATRPVHVDPSWCDEGLVTTTNIRFYSDDRLARIIGFLSTVLTSLFPAASMFVPYFINDAVVRLVVIVAMTFIFAAIVTLISNARRIEIFAATSAYAAVQVVFVSSTTGLTN